MLETIIKGGSMMAPLMLQSVLAVAVVIDRWIAFSRNDKVDSRSLRSKVLELLAAGKVADAMALCANTPGPVSAVMLAGLQAYAKFARVTAGRPETCRALVEDAMENYSQVASSALNKRLSVLSFVAGSAPLLGMLGTVTGMISAFAGMAVGGVSNETVSAGISEALITTAAGLIISLIAVVPYHYLTARAGAVAPPSPGRLLRPSRPPDHPQPAASAVPPCPSSGARKNAIWRFPPTRCRISRFC
jgi:biopolymer transport protein ExbB